MSVFSNTSADAPELRAQYASAVLSLLGDRAQGIANLPELNDLAQRRRLVIDETCMIDGDLRVLARMEVH